jgi:hypothetical protein
MGQASGLPFFFMLKLSSVKKFGLKRPLCPSCRTEQDLNLKTDACPACGFSVARADEWFRFEVPPVAELIDMPDMLSKQDINYINKERTRLTRLFPDIFLSIMVLEAPDYRSLLEFVCWYHNQAQPPENGVNMENGLILILDPGFRQAAMSVGYRLEPFLNPDHVETMLKACTEKAKKESPGKALASYIKNLREQLLISWKSHK